MRKIVAKRKYKYPMALEREYAKQLAGLTDAMFRTIKKDVPQMVGLVKRNQITMDADDPNEDLDKLMEYLASVLLLKEKSVPYVDRMWDKVNRYTDKEIKEIFMAIFGASVSLRGLRAEWTQQQIVKELSEEAEKRNVELTKEEMIAIGSGILLSSMLSASEEKRKAIESILKDRPAGADIIASSEAQMALTAQAKLKQMEEIWVRENLDLIGSLEAETLRKLRDELTRLIADGVPEDEIEERLIAYLEKQLEMETNRAVLIGSDQVGKLNGRLMEYWQRSAGIKEYRWQTMMDSRVRPLHAERQGMIFQWDKPPSDGHPGMAVRCRCVADPVISLDDYGVEPIAKTYIYVD
jgi:SPP1 gp7 family putative phage head morphogenesis protein